VDPPAHAVGGRAVDSEIDTDVEAGITARDADAERIVTGSGSTNEGGSRLEEPSLL